MKPLCYFSLQMSVILISSIGSFKSFYCCFRSFRPNFQGCLTCTERDDWMRVLAQALRVGIGLTFNPASVLSLDELYCPGLWILASTFLTVPVSLTLWALHRFKPPHLLFNTVSSSPLSLIAYTLCRTLPFRIAETSVMLHNSVAYFDIQFFKITSVGPELELPHYLVRATSLFFSISLPLCPKNVDGLLIRE